MKQDATESAETAVPRTPVRPKVGDLILWLDDGFRVGMKITEFRETEIVGNPTDSRSVHEHRFDPAGLFDGRIALAEKCNACNGRGWHVGECHPMEECGDCWGQGVVVHDEAF